MMIRVKYVNAVAEEVYNYSFLSVRYDYITLVFEEIKSYITIDT